MRNAFVIFLLPCALFAACGQRGPLYLPDEPREKVSTTKPAPAAPVASPILAPEATADEREGATRRNRN